MILQLPHDTPSVQAPEVFLTLHLHQASAWHNKPLFSNYPLLAFRCRQSLTASATHVRDGNAELFHANWIQGKEKTIALSKITGIPKHMEARGKMPVISPALTSKVSKTLMLLSNPSYNKAKLNEQALDLHRAAVRGLCSPLPTQARKEESSRHTPKARSVQRQRVISLAQGLWCPFQWEHSSGKYEPRTMCPRGLFQYESNKNIFPTEMTIWIWKWH